MDKTVTSNSQAVDDASHPDIAIGNADSESVQAFVEPRPVPEITAEIIRDMDKLCDWLHKVQKLHLQITQMRQQRMEDEIAARWAQIHEQDRVLMSSNDRV